MKEKMNNPNLRTRKENAEKKINLMRFQTFSNTKDGLNKDQKGKKETDISGSPIVSSENGEGLFF